MSNTDFNSIHEILNKLDPAEREIISSQMKKGAFRGRQLSGQSTNVHLEKVKLRDGSHLTFGIGGEKRTLRIYGLQRRPVTLYANQWLKLLEVAPELQDFIAKNSERLSFEKAQS